MKRTNGVPYLEPWEMEQDIMNAAAARVRAYLREHPDATDAELCRAAKFNVVCAELHAVER